MLNGFGRVIKPNYYYVGYWKDNQFHGYGKQVFKNGKKKPLVGKWQFGELVK